MINVIVPIAGNSKGFQKILTRLSHISTVNVYVGIIESQYDELVDYLGETENVFIHAYEDNSNIDAIDITEE